MTMPSFTCPRPECGRTSYNPNDVREGYCGNCHDWTGQRSSARPDVEVRPAAVVDVDARDAHPITGVEHTTALPAEDRKPQ